LKNILYSREIIRKIIRQEDSKMLVIAGPCSIHDYDSAVQLAKDLKKISDEYKDKAVFVMRAYHHKPRSKGKSWEGFMTDPDIDGSYDIEKGILSTRKLYNEIAELGIPIATEFLDILDSQYLGDLISWGAVGARSSEYQPLINEISGLDFPVGFKNNTSGNIQSAVFAASKAKAKAVLKSINENGDFVKKITSGNFYTHVILRGGEKPNYDEESVAETVKLMRKEKINPASQIETYALIKLAISLKRWQGVPFYLRPG